MQVFRIANERNTMFFKLHSQEAEGMRCVQGQEFEAPLTVAWIFSGALSVEMCCNEDVTF